MEKIKDNTRAEDLRKFVNGPTHDMDCDLLYGGDCWCKGPERIALAKKALQEWDNRPAPPVHTPINTRKPRIFYRIDHRQNGKWVAQNVWKNEWKAYLAWKNLGEAVIDRDENYRFMEFNLYEICLDD